MRRSSVNRSLILVTLLLVTVAHLPAPASVVFVDSAATGSDNGTSWDDAYADLQTALGTAAPPDSIWVAAGTYYPSSVGNRDSTFQLVDGVAIYGGFAGTETALSQRDWVANLTVLSGDIGVVGDNIDNSYHVVTGSGTGPSAVLDGFTITKGNAEISGTMDERSKGGGMYVLSGSPAIDNVAFLENAAEYFGGAMYIDDSSPTLTNVVFEGNVAGQRGGAIYGRDNSSPNLTGAVFLNNVAAYGGAIYNTFSSPTLVNALFTGNTSVGHQGGAIYNHMWSDASLTNVTFSNNTATYYGGGIFNNSSHPTLVNTIMWGDSGESGGNEIYNYSSTTTVSHSLIGGGLTAGCVNGGNNTFGDPLFVDGPGGDLHLIGPASPAFDSGDNAAPGIPVTDLDGNDRVRNGTIDMGAYELQAEGAVVVLSPWTAVIEEAPWYETTCDTIRVVNTGSEACALAEISGCSAPPFSIDTSMTAGTLGPGESTEFLVCVTPTVVGADTCEVTVVTDAWNTHAVAEVRLDAVTGISTPEPFRIVSVTPNPFNPATAVHFTLPSTLAVTAEVISVAGARVRVLADEEPFGPGDNRLTWDGRTDRGLPAASGVYFIRIETAVGVEVARAVLLK